MIGVAWCTCALLVLVSARIYERCELARELMELGINHVDISTWVCIAFHESRFDTAANNYHSGDHGIFQISELYWCGKGKACHLPCSALKDDDITDDMECALQIHEEHTRLQGDGFLAWVVYPHHCRQNTKKYVADCDYQSKSYTPKSRPRIFNTYYDNDFYDSNETEQTYFKSEKSPPAFLAISSIFRANYGKLNLNTNGRYDWLNYKVDNIDDLKLPVFDKTGVVTTPTTTTTISSITYPPVKPWRVIETNQFRHKNKSQEKSTVKPVTLTTSASTTQNSVQQITTFKPTLVPSGYNLVKTTRKQYDLPLTTIKPTLNSFDSTRVTYSFIPWTYTTTYKPHTIPTTKLTSPSYTSAQSTISTSSTNPKSVSTYRPFFTSTTEKPLQTTTIRTTTIKPLQWTSVKPSLSTSKLLARTQTNLFESRLSSSKTTTTPLPTKYYSFTPRPTTVPSKVTTVSPKLSSTNGIRSTLNKTNTTQTTRTTQSIFDLYLNPTKRPKLAPYNYTSFINSRFQLIFSGGTTIAPILKPLPSTL